MAKRVLLIDDEPHWIEFAQSDLSEFDIVVACDAEEALAILTEKNDFDLVIASSRQLDALEAIRRRFGPKRRPVVVTTIRPTMEEARDAYRLGATRYCTKSFERAELRECVSEIIPSPN